jgi:hypothetical protein
VGEKGDVVRKVMFMAALAAATVFALSAVQRADAWGCGYSCSPSVQVYIEWGADYSWSLFIVPVVDVRCSGGVPNLLTGHLIVKVTQLGHQSASGHDAIGSGEADVNCDGTWHRVAVSVVGQFNLGCAMAHADFLTPTGEKIPRDGVDRLIQITS